MKLIGTICHFMHIIIDKVETLEDSISAQQTKMYIKKLKSL